MTFYSSFFSDGILPSFFVAHRLGTNVSKAVRRHARCPRPRFDGGRKAEETGARSVPFVAQCYLHAGCCHDGHWLPYNRRNLTRVLAAWSYIRRAVAFPLHIVDSFSLLHVLCYLPVLSCVNHVTYTSAFFSQSNTLFSQILQKQKQLHVRLCNECGQ